MLVTHVIIVAVKFWSARRRTDVRYCARVKKSLQECGSLPRIVFGSKQLVDLTVAAAEAQSVIETCDLDTLVHRCEADH
jgi:hypothetical protein